MPRPHSASWPASIPATIGAVAYALDATPVALYLALVLAGGGEGALLALAQAHVLRRELPGFDRRAWVAATALAAAFAWSLGLLPSTLGSRLESVPFLLLLPVVAVLATALLLSLGVAQWLVLRRCLSGSRRWILANALAWIAGLAVCVPFMSALITDRTSPAEAAGIGIGAGLLMGASVAAVTGWFLVRMVRER